MRPARAVHNMSYSKQLCECYAGLRVTDCLVVWLQLAGLRIYSPYAMQQAMSEGESHKRTRVGAGIRKDNLDGGDGLCCLLQCILELVQLGVVLHNTPGLRRCHQPMTAVARFCYVYCHADAQIHDLTAKKR